MQNTAFVRSVDMLGRVVLPSELRKRLDIRQNDLLKVETDEEKGTIILEKLPRETVGASFPEKSIL